MVVLTLIFISLYGAALIGWLKPLADDRMVMRLEPIIFVIIGYYFGRLPGQQNERTLKQEISRQTQRADASQSAKEQALQANEAWRKKSRIRGPRWVQSRPASPHRDLISSPPAAAAMRRELATWWARHCGF